MGLLLYTILLVVFITLLYKNSYIARYYLKYLFFSIFIFILALTTIPLMLHRPRDPKNTLIPGAVVRLFFRLIGTTISLEGRENIVQNSSCVVLINHQSVLDLLVLAKLVPAMDNCSVISKKEILYVPLFGIGAWLCGTIFIDKVRKGKAQATVNETGKTITIRKAQVLIFPGGARNFSDKLLLPFKKGAFHLALAAKCPIQPVVTNKFKWLGYRRFDEGHIRVKILPPISTEGYTVETMNELIENTYNIMLEHIDLLTKQEDNMKKMCQF